MGKLATEEIACECGQALGEACEWVGPQHETVIVEYMPDFLRGSHSAAGNSGFWPHNGALRLRVERSCAERLTHEYDEDGRMTDEPSEWAEILDEATADHANER
jgi:hypothetical protein